MNREETEAKINELQEEIQKMRIAVGEFDQIEVDKKIEHLNSRFSGKAWRESTSDCWRLLYDFRKSDKDHLIEFREVLVSIRGSRMTLLMGICIVNASSTIGHGLVEIPMSEFEAKARTASTFILEKCKEVGNVVL